MFLAEKTFRHAPSSMQEVIQWIENGQVSPVEAFRLFEQVGETVLQSIPEEDAASRIKSIMSELDELIGLSYVKELVKEIQAFVEIQRRRSEVGLRSEAQTLHMVFKGNPGTGKTTVARIFGRLFHEIGVLQKGHLVEVERADLVGEYIGHTALKTRENVKKAMGGILFIDEAYSLARGGDKDFGKEAIDTLVKAMEDHKDNLVLILAGYRREMEYFLRTNPGLRSRFPIQLDFPDYSADDLLAIAELMLKQREYYLTDSAKDYLRRVIEDMIATGAIQEGNARFVRNVVEKAIRQQAVRLVRHNIYSRRELMQIHLYDLEGCLTS